MNSSLICWILLCGIALMSARPQDTESTSDSLAQSPPSATAIRSNVGAYSSGGSSSDAGALAVECGRIEVSRGQFRFGCKELRRGNPDAITLGSEHVLRLNHDDVQEQTIDVLVPNYRIDELIKTGFKGSSDGSTRVNILLKRPEQTYNAEIGERAVPNGAPSVAVQYEPVDKLLVHYPNDKPYQPNSGAILPPA